MITALIPTMTMNIKSHVAAEVILQDRNILAREELGCWSNGI